ncbi:MAG TPA: hypothetical protein VHG89_04865 [Verrucomicrobiae bacterium]|nr:hypothetical protein [Verrucomicrobiae bacterium]
MSENNDNSIGDIIAQDAAAILLNVVPSLQPYGAAITLAFEVVSATAPAIYSEITALIQRIQNGGEPTADDIAKVRALIASLKNPDAYFQQ